MKNANEQRKLDIEKKETLAKLESKKILDKAQEEAENIKDRVISNFQLQVRNKALFEKQKYVSEVLNKAVIQLEKINEAEFLKFVETQILTSNMAGDEELILSKKYRNMDITGINQKLKDQGKIGNLKISQGEREVVGGFIAIKGGVETNGTFSALVEDQRDELEMLIVKELF